MKTMLAALALSLLSSAALADWDDCRNKAVEVQLNITPIVNGQIGTPAYETEVFDTCIRENTLVTLHALATLSSSFRYWQKSFETGRVAIGHSMLILNCSTTPDLGCPTWRFLATFKNVEVD
jgi:hypothetical protein